MDVDLHASVSQVGFRNPDAQQRHWNLARYSIDVFRSKADEAVHDHVGARLCEGESTADYRANVFRNRAANDNEVRILASVNGRFDALAHLLDRLQDARRWPAGSGPRFHLFWISAVLDMQSGNARPLIQLHSPEHVQRRLTRLVSVDDSRNGHFTRNPSGKLHHLSCGDHAPVRYTEICQRHHVAADVDRIESAGFGELTGN